MATFPHAERLSLCMIVRNEGPRLAACLASARPFCGELVVVDTGSTDDTVAIAEAHGARVLHHPWADDFAEARNVALDAATRPWALVLDADERLEVLDPVELGKALSQDLLQGFSFRIWNQLDDGTQSQAMVFRLFRRDLAGMRYRGALHEQVVAVAEGRMQTAALGCAVLHHEGYLAEAVASQGKKARNVRLAHKLVAQRPEDPYAHYALAQAHQQAQAWPEALGAYEEALRRLGAQVPDDAFGLALHVHAVQLMRAMGQGAKAKALLGPALVAFPHSPDLRIHRAQLALEAGDFALAEADARVALGPEAAASSLIEAPGHVAWEAQTVLGLALAGQGRPQEAEAAWVQALAQAPRGFVKPHRLLGKLRLEQGRWAEAAELLGQAQGQDPEAVRLDLAWAWHKLGRHGEAAALLQSGPLVPQAQLLLGRVLLAAGKAAEALPHLVACPLPAAALPRGWAYVMTGETTAATASFLSWLGAGAGDWATKDALALAMTFLSGEKRRQAFPERPQEPLAELGQWFRLLLRHQAFSGVEAFIEGAQQQGPWWPPLRKDFGIALAQEGFAELALELLLPAREAEPEEPEIYAWLGMAALERDLPEVAGDMWAVALELAPGHPIALEGMRLLGALAPVEGA